MKRVTGVGPEGGVDLLTHEELSSLEVTRNYKGEYGYTAKFYLEGLEWGKAAGEHENVKTWFDLKFGKGGE